MILAAAGLKRLGLRQPHRDRCWTPTRACRRPGRARSASNAASDRPDLIAALSPLADRATMLATTAERAFSRALGGSCHTPLAGYAEWEEGALWLRGLLASRDGHDVIRGEIDADVADSEGAEALGPRSPTSSSSAARRGSSFPATVSVHPLRAPGPPPGPLAGAGILVTRPARQAAGLVARTRRAGRDADRVSRDRDPAAGGSRGSRPRARGARRLRFRGLRVRQRRRVRRAGHRPMAARPAHVRARAGHRRGAGRRRHPRRRGARRPRSTATACSRCPSLRNRAGKRVADLPRRRRPRATGRHARARGAHVDYVSCYRRAPPATGAGLAEVFAQGRVACAHAHVERRPRQPVALLDAARAAGSACRRSSRIRAIATQRELGFTAVETAGSDAGLIAGLLEMVCVAPRPRRS